MLSLLLNSCEAYWLGLVVSCWTIAISSQDHSSSCHQIKTGLHDTDTLGL